MAAKNLRKTPEYTSVSPLNSNAIVSNTNFDKMMKVLTYQRCMNCHPNDNIPKQGDTSHPHYFNITGGENDHGFQAIQCHSCHQSENNDYSGVPGAPHWALAPASMAWEGFTRTEIAERILDTSLNGGKNHEELVKHMTEDELVLWAWEPGIDANGLKREIPPVSKAAFKDAVKQWFAAGAIIPSE